MGKSKHEKHLEDMVKYNIQIDSSIFLTPKEKWQLENKMIKEAKKLEKKELKESKKAEKDKITALSARERDNARIKAEKQKNSKKLKKVRPPKVKKTVQDTLPYIHICNEYIFEVEENKFSKTYIFSDVNYTIAHQDEQESIFLGYCSVLNSFDSSVNIQVTVHNNKVNKADFNNMVLLKHKNNEFDRYIDIYNKMLTEKMKQGQNGIIRNKYITITVPAADLYTAEAKFSSIDLELTNSFKRIGSSIYPLTSNERVTLMKDIFRNVDEIIPELSAKDFKRKADRAYCCPDYFEFKTNYFMFGSKYARCVFVKDYPASLQDNLITELSETDLSLIITTNIFPIDTYKALRTVNRQNINGFRKANGGKKGCKIRIFSGQYKP